VAGPGLGVDDHHHHFIILQLIEVGTSLVLFVLGPDVPSLG